MPRHVMSIFKKSLVTARFFFYPKSPYSFLRYFLTNVSNCFDLLILYFLFTFSNSSISSGGNVIFILFRSFFSSKSLTSFIFRYMSKIRFYVYKVKSIHKNLHIAQCTPRGGRSTPLGKSSKNHQKSRSKFQVQNLKNRTDIHQICLSIYSNFLLPSRYRK